MFPPYLIPGDTIAIAAPARSISHEQLNLAIQYVESKGYKILIPDELFAINNQFGGSETQRAQLFNDLVKNKIVKAIWCARGGYGSLRMIDLIDISLLKINPKWLVGFSDITVMHSHVLKNCNMASLHATMPIFMHEKKEKDYEDVSKAIDSMLAVLSGQQYQFNLKENKKLNNSNFTGKIVGGNLSVLASIVDSVSEISFDNNILFIEDLDEYYYHLDRMLLMFKRSGRLKNLKALLVGSFIQMHDHKIPFGKTTHEIITEHCSTYGYPIIFDINSGHHLQNLAIPLGVPANYQDGILTFATS